MLSTRIDFNSSLWTCDFWSKIFIQFEAFLQVAPFCIIEWSSKCKRWTFSASVHFANKNNAARMKGLFIDVNFDGIEKLPDLGHKESTRPVKGDGYWGKFSLSNFENDKKRVSFMKFSTLMCV